MTRIGLTQLLLPTLFSTVAFAQAQPPLGAPAAAEAADTPEPADTESDAVMPVDTQTQINDLR